jgi:hypothetical protein
VAEDNEGLAARRAALVNMLMMCWESGIVLASRAVASVSLPSFTTFTLDVAESARRRLPSLLGRYHVTVCLVNSAGHPEVVD